MSQAKPLNPVLYGLLQRRFGEVGIAAPRQEIDWYVVYGSLEERRNGESRPRRKIRTSGEEYYVRCPFCRDATRARLYINHMWGKWDPETQSENLFAAQCFNEQCLDSWEKQKELRDMVFDHDGPQQMNVEKGEPAPPPGSEVPPAGVEIPIGDLKRRHPHHQAVLYLESRGFDPDWLQQRYRVTFCAHSRYGLARNRIIIPIHMNGKLVFWQARYPADDVNGRSFKEARVPKFWSTPNGSRALLGYNIEIAAQHQTIVIVEGATDVWNAGPQTWGVLGKKMGDGLLRRFTALVRKYHPSQPPVVCVALDPEQDPKEKAKGKPHHIDAMVSQLLGVGLPAFGLYLPEGSDPGNTDRALFRDWIKAAAAEHGLRAGFQKPKELVL